MVVPVGRKRPLPYGGACAAGVWFEHGAAPQCCEAAQTATCRSRCPTPAPGVSALLPRPGPRAQRGLHAVQDSALQLREKAANTGDVTVRYIQNEPVKAVLIAAATGAALMGLVRS